MVKEDATNSSPWALWGMAKLSATLAAALYIAHVQHPSKIPVWCNSIDMGSNHAAA